MPREPFAPDYVPVADRIAEFYRKHPEGSLQSEVLTLTDNLVLVKAWAYRTPDDTRPGIGHSSLGIPGSTPYTRGSEAENAETSAWGRAIAALGFEVKHGIATAEDVRNKSGTQERPQQPAQRQAAPSTAPHPVAAPGPSTAPSGGLSMSEAMDAMANVDKKAISEAGKRIAGTWSLKEMTPQQRAAVVADLTGGAPPAAPDDGEDWGGMFDKVPA